MPPVGGSNERQTEIRAAARARALERLGGVCVGWPAAGLSTHMHECPRWHRSGVYPW